MANHFGTLPENLTYNGEVQVDKTAFDLQFVHDSYSIAAITQTIDKEVSQGNLKMAIKVLKSCLIDMEGKVK